jgi:hypothetical protein
MVEPTTIGLFVFPSTSVSEELDYAREPSHPQNWMQHHVIGQQD